MEQCYRCREMRNGTVRLVSKPANQGCTSGVVFKPICPKCREDRFVMPPKRLMNEMPDQMNEKEIAAALAVFE